MERKISLSKSHESLGLDGKQYWIWKDILTKDGEVVQKMELKLEDPIRIGKRGNNEIHLLSRIQNNSFYIILNSEDNLIKYQQDRDENIMVATSVKNDLLNQLKEYFTEVKNGDRYLEPFEFTDRDNTTDPVTYSQAAGKRRQRKTRRHRRS